jgi:A/G-specific adenine glycosylase
MPDPHPLLATFANQSRGALRRPILQWYSRHARPLPWRSTADPYRIWISEVMLQQTTVAAVIPYFERFLDRFPTVHELAEAAEEDVLRLWEGLGYYSRARNLHRTAQILVRERAGVFPDEIGPLRELPGIGRYTAGAIASFAFDRPAPIVEANTQRLYCRLLGYRGDPRSAEGQNLLWSFAGQILPRRSAGQFNQALMELGATICTAENPACERCPARRCCLAFASKLQSQIPQPAIRPRATEVTEVAVAIERGGKYLLRKRPAGERWAGLWDFVRFPIETGQPSERPSVRQAKRGPKNRDRPRALSPLAASGASGAPIARAELAQRVARETGMQVGIGELLAELRHSVTRFRISLFCYAAAWQSGERRTAGGESEWVALHQFEAYPLSVTGRKISQLLVRRSERQPTRSRGTSPPGETLAGR